MNTQRLIEDVRAAGLLLQVDNGNLVVESDHEPPETLIAELRLHKAEVIGLLAPCRGSAPPPSGLTGAALVLDEERAAIVEHDGAVPRAWAEGYARLDRERPPADVPVGRWQRFVDDVGQFIDSAFCRAATALGWTPHDLFGCDRQRPFARIDRAGLLWLLNGDKLLMLTADRATIETQNGNRRTYYRKPSDRGGVVPWELDESFSKPSDPQPVPF